MDVDGVPYWWNNDGIYTVGVANASTGAVEVASITERTIKAFFADIPTENKKYVRGSYNVPPGRSSGSIVTVRLPALWTAMSSTGR